MQDKTLIDIFIKNRALSIRTFNIYYYDLYIIYIRNIPFHLFHLKKIKVIHNPSQ